MIEKDNAIFMEQEEYAEWMKKRLEEESALEQKQESEPEKKQAEAPLGTLYELNQQIIGGMRTLKRGEYPVKKMKKWIMDNLNHQYYMLLCNELSYYTVFHINHPEEPYVSHLLRELCDIIEGLGSVKTIEADNNDALAVWSTYQGSEDVHCFYLFPYDAGVVEV